MTETEMAADKKPAGNLTLRQLSHLMDSLGAVEDDPELQLVELQANQVLFRQGDEAHSMYVLVSGLLDVRLTHADGTESVIDRLQPGAIVGEMALLSGQPRSATVYAVNGASLINLSRTQAKGLARTDVGAKMALEAVAAPRWQRIQLAKALQGLFGDLQPNSLHAIQQELEWLHFSNGDVVFRQGDPPDGLYIVINGRLRFQMTAPNGQMTASGEVGAGEMVGEFALLTEEARSATVFATRETNVARMSQATLQRMVPRHPELMMNITRRILQRWREGQAPAKPVALSGLSLAILPASPEGSVGSFAQALCATLTAYGSTLALDCRQFDQRYGQVGASQLEPDDPAHPAIVAWMDELEAETDFLIFVADPEPSAWTRRCIGQADRVLILADPYVDPTPGAAERLLTEMQVPVRSELVLWHPAETEVPQGTLAWLKGRQLHAHHHIRRDDPRHMERLARRLTGRAIALVLSGGAARGFAHLGVHRALEELNIPIDYLGGTSMGAVMAGCFLVSDSNAELMDMASQFANAKTLFDPTLPITALMASNKVTRFCQSFYGDLRIEDAWLPSFFVASNLSTAEPVVYRQGPLWRAIRASLAIPGVFGPVMEDDEMLVDGGVMDNFPVSVMAELCESEHIIGVSVSPYRVKKRQYDYETGVSGWRVLFSRLNPFTKSLRAPPIAYTIVRSLEINSVRLSRAQQAQLDLFLYPEPKGYGLLDFDKYRTITQVGYEATLEPLRQWKQQRFGV